MSDFDHDVFVSYRRDRDGMALRDEIMALLRGRITLWTDAYGLPAGEGVPDLGDKIERSRIFLVAFTPKYAKRKDCEGELELATKRGKPVVVCTRPEFLASPTPLGLGRPLMRTLPDDREELTYTLLPDDRQRKQRIEFAIQGLEQVDETTRETLERAFQCQLQVDPLRDAVRKCASLADWSELHRRGDHDRGFADALGTYLGTFPPYLLRTPTAPNKPITTNRYDNLLRRFLDSHPPPLLGDPLRRPEVDRLLDILRESGSAILRGPPGSGKSTVLRQVVARLSTEFDVLPLRIDRDLQDSITDLGLQVGLSSSLSEALANPRLVAVIDQIDALHELAGARSDLLEAVCRLIAAVRRAGRALLLCGRENELADLQVLRDSWAGGDKQPKPTEVDLAPLSEELVANHLREWCVDDRLASTFHVAELTAFDLDLLYATRGVPPPPNGWTRPRLLDAFVAQAQRDAGVDDTDLPLKATLDKLLDEIAEGERGFAVDAGWSAPQLRAVEALAKARLLVHSGVTTSFRHQRFGEHLLARRVLTSGGPRAWLVALPEQDLQHRPLLHHALECRLDGDPTGFVNDALELLDEKVRPHMRVILADVLRLRGHPDGEEAAVVEHLLRSHVPFHRQLGWKVIFARSEWTAWLLDGQRSQTLPHATDGLRIPRLIRAYATPLPDSTGHVFAALVRAGDPVPVRTALTHLRDLPATWRVAMQRAAENGLLDEFQARSGHEGPLALLELVGRAWPADAELAALFGAVLKLVKRQHLNERPWSDWPAILACADHYPVELLAALGDTLTRFATEARSEHYPTSDLLDASFREVLSGRLVDLTERAITVVASRAGTVQELLPPAVLAADTKTARRLRQLAGEALDGRSHPRGVKSPTMVEVKAWHEPVSAALLAVTKHDPMDYSDAALTEAVRVGKSEPRERGDEVELQRFVFEATRQEPHRCLRWLNLQPADSAAVAVGAVLQGVANAATGTDHSALAERATLICLNEPRREGWRPASDLLRSHPEWDWHADILKALCRCADNPAAHRDHGWSHMDSKVTPAVLGMAVSDRAELIACLTQLLHADRSRWPLVERTIRAAAADPHPVVRIKAALACLAIPDGTPGRLDLAADLYLTIVTDTVDVMLAAVEPLNALSWLKWHRWDRLRPVIERMIASEVDEVAEAGAIQASIATLNDHQQLSGALELTLSCLASERAPHRRGVAQVLSANPDEGTNHPIVGPLWPHWLRRLCDDPDDEAVKHAMQWPRHAEPMKAFPALFGAVLGTRGVHVDPFHLIHQLTRATPLPTGWILALLHHDASHPLPPSLTRHDGLTLLRRAALQDPHHRRAWLDLVDKVVSQSHDAVDIVLNQR
jgi:hypothetical protein